MGQREGQRSMLANNAEMPTRSSPSREGKRRLFTIDHLDGRTIAARRARELMATFSAGLGGTLTAGQSLAIGRAAQLVALAEDARARRLDGDMTVTLEDLVRIDNSASRAVRQLGIPEAAAPTTPPSLRDYVAARTGSPEVSVASEAVVVLAGEKSHQRGPHDNGDAS
jgi:hypothetical protein